MINFELFLTDAYSLPSGYFGQGTGSVQIDQFACTGSESALLQCSHLTIDSCTYAQNAGVRCSQPGLHIVYRYNLYCYGNLLFFPS